jgi:hypothetical protein
LVKGSGFILVSEYLPGIISVPLPGHFTPEGANLKERHRYFMHRVPLLYDYTSKQARCPLSLPHSKLKNHSATKAIYFWLLEARAAVSEV